MGEGLWGCGRLGSFDAEKGTCVDGEDVLLASCRFFLQPVEHTLTSLQEIYRHTHSWTRASEIWALGATVYTMMTGMPPPRLYNYEWQISRMTDKGFSQPIREIVADMLRPHPNDRIQTLVLVNRVNDAWEGWRATTEEGAHFVDVIDKVVLRSVVGAGGRLIL